MRTGYLVAAVMLFATTGAAFAQDLEGVLEVTATGGGAQISARAAARMERRELRRERRAAELDELRAARGLRGRNASAASSLVADEAGARLMFVAEENGDQIEAVEPTEPQSREVQETGSEPGEGEFFILPFFEEEPSSDLVDCFPAEIIICEAGPAHEGYEPEDGLGDEDLRDDGVGDDGIGDDELYIYTLSSSNGEAVFRGNARGNARRNVRGNAQVVLDLLQPLDGFTGPSAGNGPASVAVEASAAHPGMDPARAAQLLSDRLAQIDRMRDRALAEGNAALLETADMLEQSVRARFETSGSATVDPAAEPAPTDAAAP